MKLFVIHAFLASIKHKIIAVPKITHGQQIKKHVLNYILKNFKTVLKMLEIVIMNVPSVKLIIICQLKNDVVIMDTTGIQVPKIA